MRTYTTIDCIKMVPFEKLMLRAVQGLLYEEYNNSPSDRDKASAEDIQINVTTRGRLIEFRITPSYPGLLNDLADIAESVMFGVNIQGAFITESHKSYITWQRFDVIHERVILNNYVKTHVKDDQ